MIWSIYRLSRKYDYLIVGAGLYGATFAQQAARSNKTSLVIDKRNHIGGNCYTEKRENDIDVHVYGCHIFNTDKKYVWDYIRQFAEFNNYRHTGKVNYNGKIYSFPINLMTLQQVWGVITPQEAIAKINQSKIKIPNPQNVEDWCLSHIGQELYEIFIKGYTAKQWGVAPDKLPASIIKRLPVRFCYDENYYHDNSYQGIPVNGYTSMIENLLDDPKIQVDLNRDFSQIVNDWEAYANRLIYCGPIDVFFNYKFGKLDYRSLRWEHEFLDINDYQGSSVINYTSENPKYTRIIEHKHFCNLGQKGTIISKEFPMNCEFDEERYYPINNKESYDRYQKYRSLAKQNKNILFSGRLGKFKYLDMDDCIALAIKEENVSSK